MKVFYDHPQAFVSGGGFEHFVAVTFEKRSHGGPEVLIVIDQEYFCGHASLLPAGGASATRPSCAGSRPV